MKKRINLIAAAGTFDRLHKGHEFFLKRAFSIGVHVFVGITSDRFVKKKLLGFAIQPYRERRKALVGFLKRNGYFSRTTLFPLDDVYGPSLNKDSPIEAILVTEKTLSGAQLINRKREQLKLAPLKIIEIPLLKKGVREEISSSEVRKTLILTKSLLLPQRVRPLLKKPWGKLLKGRGDDLTIAAVKAKKILDKNRPILTITVGDVVTYSFNKINIPINLAIVDFKIKREKKIKNLAELGFKKGVPDLTVDNPPGRIFSSLSGGIKNIIKKLANQPSTHNSEPITIKVLGEEDLAVLPVIVLTPENSAVFYGQPQEGIVFIEVDEEAKNRTLNLLSKFKTDN